ncbi:Stp1/IreP family PP2C-type Ser/Thr phosphatase [Marininema halotolerans]|uniref:Protein phosphatase n=1 Tax=Marininema halotolerans TaxID=1155944 RepID=A0A1I6QFQ1_9BACL|nr:Stp1/IreP family PP2C-type Ser/Thr phosphatase [Marininema halotolerans]SFS51120.1 protein phosphatase [Marininema halotolerans]
MEKAWHTHNGRVRDHNEDSVGLFQSEDGVPVAVIADGMGGHQAGDIASQSVVRVIKEELRTLKREMDTDKRSKLTKKAVAKANREVYEMSSKNNQLKGMGTTTITAVLGDDEIVLAHIGDSRAYLLHDDGLYQLTEDHSLVNVLKKHGEITEEEAKVHPQRNVIVRAVGTNEEVETDMIITPWYKGDILMICSDGLSNMVEVDEMGTVLTANLPLSKQADLLLERALDAGGTDNISIILIKHDGSIHSSN